MKKIIFLLLAISVAIFVLAARQIYTNSFPMPIVENKEMSNGIFGDCMADHATGDIYSRDDPWCITGETAVFVIVTRPASAEALVEVIETPDPTKAPVATDEPTQEPTNTPDPTSTPDPTQEPKPTQGPTQEPTQGPTQEPTQGPTQGPTQEPSTPDPTQEHCNNGAGDGSDCTPGKSSGSNQGKGGPDGDRENQGEQGKGKEKHSFVSWLLSL